MLSIMHSFSSDRGSFPHFCFYSRFLAKEKMKIILFRLLPKIAFNTGLYAPNELKISALVFVAFISSKNYESIIFFCFFSLMPRWFWKLFYLLFSPSPPFCLPRVLSCQHPRQTHGQTCFSFSLQSCLEPS